jgi:hypothetical protein
MTRIAMVADCHLANHKKFGGEVRAGVNSRARLILDVLYCALDKAADIGADQFWVLGDLFDGVRPEPQLIGEVQRLFADSQFDRGHIVLLLGNHEQVSRLAGDNSLAPLAPVATLCELVGAENGVRFFPYAPRDWKGTIEATMTLNKNHNPPVRLAVAHVGLIEPGTPFMFRDHQDAVDVDWLGEILAEHGVKHFVAGHWHAYWNGVRSGTHLWQLGALCPTGWDNPGPGYGKMLVVDTGGTEMTTELHELPGPRFINLRADDPGDLVLPAGLTGCQVFVRIVVSAGSMPWALQWLEQEKVRGSVEDGEVLIDGQEAEQAAREAAGAARSSETLQQALDGYVRSMQLPDGVTRETVLAECRRYLGV